MEWSFVGVGSLIHPIAMILIILSWILVAILGVLVRRDRISPSPQGDRTSLLPRGARDVARRKRWHHKLAALLLSLSIFFTGVAMFNTYARSGRLFPGGHLYGAFWTLVVLSLQNVWVPWFQDSVVTRSIHAAGGFVAITLLLWQSWTGFPILLDVWKNITAA